MSAPIVARAVVGPFRQNSYVLGDPDTKEAVLVDPGDQPEAIESLLTRHGFTPKFILNTHAHLDHVGAVAHFQERFGLPFYLHAGEQEWLEGLPLQARMFGVAPPPIPRVDRWIVDGDLLPFGSRTIEVIHTPGHTPGGCCLFLRDERILFTGDTLFAGSIGRTDFPGGSFPQLEASIRERLFPLGDDVVIYSGHGPASTLGDERRTNPFVGDGAVPV